MRVVRMFRPHIIVPVFSGTPRDGHGHHQVAGILGIVLILVVFGSLSGATFGPVASLLSEMFPPQIRYSSMSIPYHIGTGYFGGFLPFIATALVARTGNIYAGLWYPIGIALLTFVVGGLYLKDNTGGEAAD